MMAMCNTFYHWETDNNTGFRKLYFDYTHTNIKEGYKMRFWKGGNRICSKCRHELPENTYFFASGGNKFHRYCKLCEGSPSYGWGRNYNSELNENGFHFCNKCDRILPLNNLYYKKTNGRCNKTGFSSNCKECMGMESGFTIAKINSNNEINDIQENFKICHSCRFELPNNDIYFFKKKDRENGMTICKKCKGFEYGIERINKVLRSQLKENEKFCSLCENKFHVSNMSTNSWCKKCSSKKHKTYYLNPETRNRVRVNNEKRRNKQKVTPSFITSKEIEEVFTLFKNSCVYCGMTEEEHHELFKENLHCDHIFPLIQGGLLIRGNIAPACRTCNCSKNSKDLFSFYDYNEKFTYEKLENILIYINTNLNINN